MISRTILVGRLVKDPTIRRTNTGISVSDFSIACQRDYTDADGTRPVDYFDIVAFRGTADFVSKYFRKGSLAVIDGRLQTRGWVDKEGNKRHKVEIIANSVSLGDSRSRDQVAPTLEPDRAGMQDSSRDLPF